MDVAPGPASRGGDCFFGHFVEADRLFVGRSDVAAGERDEFVDQLGHLFELGDRRPNVELSFMRLEFGVTFERFETRSRGRQWCAQLVRGVGDELALCAE